MSHSNFVLSAFARQDLKVAGAGDSHVIARFIQCHVFVMQSTSCEASGKAHVELPQSNIKEPMEEI